MPQTSRLNGIINLISKPFEQKDKSPYSLLIEISMKAHIELKYETKKHVHKNQNPTFTTNLKFDKYSSTFTAKTKQNSKHGASLEILVKIKPEVSKNVYLTQLIDDIV